MTLTVMDKTKDRLRATPEGAALLDLIAEKGSPSKLAAAVGVNQQSVRQWLLRGRISQRGALLVSERLGYDKEALRPDLAVCDWNKQPPGRDHGCQAEAKTSDARLLVELADQFGTVQSLCESAMCTTGDYHTWKSRGRIPAIKLPTFLALRK